LGGPTQALFHARVQNVFNKIRLGVPSLQDTLLKELQDSGESPGPQKKREAGAPGPTQGSVQR